jgi:hypothetical protein
VDPTQDTRSAPQNAASNAGMLLPAQATVAGIPEKSAAPIGSMGF